MGEDGSTKNDVISQHDPYTLEYLSDRFFCSFSPSIVLIFFSPEKIVSEQPCLDIGSSSDLSNGGNESSLSDLLRNPSSTDKVRSLSPRENVRFSGDVSVRFGDVQSRRTGLENLHILAFEQITMGNRAVTLFDSTN